MGSVLPSATTFSKYSRRLLVSGTSAPLDHADERQIPVALGEVEPVADDEAVLDREPEVVDLHRHARPGGLVEERADPDAPRLPRAKQVHQVRDGQARVDDVLDQQDVLVIDGAREVLRDL